MTFHSAIVRGIENLDRVESFAPASDNDDRSEFQWAPTADKLYHVGIHSVLKYAVLSIIPYPLPRCRLLSV